MTRDAYLRGVGYRLNDLPWRMRRDLLVELRGHLDELPPDTDFVARLGTPEKYAADMRSAAGLERRRGPIAFLRARRPCSLILTVAVLTVMGLAIGSIVWIDNYQPLAAGDSGLDPVGAISPPTGDGTYVVFHEGKPFQFATTIRNTGRFTLRVLGVPLLFRLPISFKLLLAPRMPLGGMHGPYRPSVRSTSSRRRARDRSEGFVRRTLRGPGHRVGHLVLDPGAVRLPLAARDRPGPANSDALLRLPKELGLPVS